VPSFEIMDISYITDINDILGITWQDKLDYLSACNCCVTHQVNKPRFFCTWVDTTPAEWYTQKQCKCTCRQLARAICRQTEEYEGVGEPAEQPTTPTSVIR